MIFAWLLWILTSNSMNCKLLFKLYNSITKNLLFFAQSVSMIAIGEESLATDQNLMESGWSYFDNRMLKMQVFYKWDEGTFSQRLLSKLFNNLLTFRLYSTIWPRLRCNLDDMHWRSRRLFGKNSNVTHFNKIMHETFQADNGAPLTKDGLIYGLSSWGFGCGTGNTIFTDLQHFKHWIQRNSIKFL